MLNKYELERKIQEFIEKSEKYFAAYQETGNGRYYSLYQKYDDLASVYRCAADSSEDRNKMISYKSQIAKWASKVQCLKWVLGERKIEETKELLTEIEAYARLNGLISKE